MEELLQRLQLHLDGFTREERYQLAIDKLKPHLDSLLQWVDAIEIESEEDEELDEDELIEKHSNIIKNSPKEIQKWIDQKRPNLNKIREIWEVSAALFDATFENYHQGATTEIGITEALCWLTVCIINEEKKLVDFHYEKFDGLDYPEQPQLIRVFYHIALSKHEIAALGPGEINELDQEVLQKISQQLNELIS